MAEDNLTETTYVTDERYRAVVAAMAEGVVIQDETGAILACNEAAERLLGLSEAQMAGRSSFDPRWRSIHEDGSTFEGETHPAMVTLRTGAPQSSVIMGVHKPDGLLTWISINTQPLRGPQGRHEGVVSTFADITLFKQTEAALRESEERYRGIVEASLEGIWSITLEGQTVFANAQMAHILGCSRDELMRASLWDFVAASDRPFVLAQLEQRGQGEPGQHDFRFRRKDGSEVWTSLSASPIRFADGRYGALAMVRDVSEAKRVERDLRQTNERLERALSAGQMWAWEVDEANRILWAQNYHAVLGLHPEQRIEQAWAFLEFVHPDDRERFRDAMQTFIAGSELRFSQECRVIRPDGKVRWMQTNAKRDYDTATGARTLLGTTIDISEIKQLEEQLVQSRKLEAIGRLAGGIAHDFNNLLTAILGAVSISERNAVNAEDSELEAIRVAAERGAALTRQLLAFARKQVVELRTLSLNATVTRLEPVLRRVVGENVVLSIELARDSWTVRGDAVLIEQVLLNLVANARDALAGRGGLVRIETRNEVRGESIEDAPAGEYAVLSVQDDGPGLTTDVREHIFEPFYTTKATGTGMGLASCYGSVKQLGGHISVESTPGRGTKFFVRLPRSKSVVAQGEPPALALPRVSHETVLLVEDEESVRKYAALGLREAGYRVLCANNAEQALQLATEHHRPIDALVTDLVLPGMDGAALARQLARSQPNLRVLFVSGYPSDVVEQHGDLGGGAVLMSKPYTLEQLATRVGQLLDSRA